MRLQLRTRVLQRRCKIHLAGTPQLHLTVRGGGDVHAAVGERGRRRIQRPQQRTVLRVL